MTLSAGECLRIDNSTNTIDQCKRHLYDVIDGRTAYIIRGIIHDLNQELHRALEATKTKKINLSYPSSNPTFPTVRPFPRTMLTIRV